MLQPQPRTSLLNWVESNFSHIHVKYYSSIAHTQDGDFHQYNIILLDFDLYLAVYSWTHVQIEHECAESDRMQVHTVKITVSVHAVSYIIAWDLVCINITDSEN